MKKLCFCLKNLDNKVPNRVKSTQLWNFCEKVKTFSRVCARQGDLFPTFSVGIKRKSKAPYLKVERFYLIVNCASSICAHSMSTCALSVRRCRLGVSV